MTDDTARRFATLLQLALAGRPLRFVEQPSKLYEIADVMADGRVRLKPYPITDTRRRLADPIVEPWSLVLEESREFRGSP